MADRKLIQFVGTDGNEYDVRDEAAQQMIGTTALPTTAQTLTGAIAEHETDLGTKADKVASAVSGNFAGLDGNGNLTDSGSNASDFVPVDREINGKALSTDVTLTGNDITVSAEDEQTVSDAVTELNTAVEAKADQTQVDKIEKELTGKADKDSVFDYKGAVPGEVVEVYDAVAEAVKTMQIEIAPVQDLHGYDKPWVGGAGRNLLPIAANLPVTIQGVEWSIRDDGAILATRKSTSSNHSDLSYADTTLQAGGYVFSCFDSECSPGGSTYQANCKTDGTSHWGTGITSISSESEISVSVVLRVYSGFTGTAIFKPMVRLSTETDATYEPYSNICPISGFTGCEVVRDGRNLACPENGLWKKGYYLDANGAEQSSNTYKYTIDFISIYGIHSLEFSVDNLANNSSAIAVCFYNKNKQFIERTVVFNGTEMSTVGHKEKNVEVPDNAEWIRYHLANDSTQYENVLIVDENVYSISFPSGQTVYGGTLTVNADGTGTLVVDNGIVVITEWKDYDSIYKRFKSASISNVKGIMARSTKCICDKANAIYDSRDISLVKNGDSYFGTATHQENHIADFYIHNNQYTDVNEFATAIGPVTVCYELYDKAIVELTAPQIRTILGYNRIYANTGSILSMLYPAEKYQTAEQADRERIHAVVDEPSAVVSITDGADNVPMGMQIAIEPVQDLHGQSSPYPAGGGKNLLDFRTKGAESELGITYTINDGVITATGTSTGYSYCQSPTFTLPAGSYKVNGNPYTNASLTLYNTSTSTGIANPSGGNDEDLTLATDTSVAMRIIVTGNAGSNVNLTFKPMIRLATETDPTYAPYSNICPITGWTGAEITRTGKNLFDCEMEQGMIASDTGLNGSSNNHIRSKNFIPVVTGQIYTLSRSVSTEYVNFRLYDKDKNYLGTSTLSAFVGIDISSASQPMASGKSKCTFSFNKPVAYFRFANYMGDLSTKYQLELGSTATACEPYLGQTYSVTFPSSAGTVYGGTLTINKNGTGTLVVDGATVTFDGSSDETINNGNASGLLRMLMRLPNDALVTGYGVSNSLSWKATAEEAQVANTVHWYKYPDSSSVPGVFADCRFTVGTYDNTSDSTRREYLAQNPIQFVYELSEKITYTLPAPVIRSLLGANNVWANTGNVLHLDYTADGKLYIDTTDNRITSVLNAMVAPVLPSMVADTALSVNDFRIVNDTLYRVTASIASGGTLTVGTNVVKTSIGEQITALLNAN